MQINKNTYVEIEIQDLNVKDFLQPGDLLDLQIIETAGTSLPVIYAAFLTAEEKIINHFIQRNTVIVKVGTSKEDCDSFLVSIYSPNPPNNGAMGNRRLVEFGGVVLNQNFMVNLVSDTYFGNSLLVTKALLKKSLGIDEQKGFLTSVTKVNENQVKWMQNNKTSCLFLAEVLTHMDIRPSFPLFGFDRHGTFYLQDFDKRIAAGASINFVSREPQKSNEIQYINNFSVEAYKEMYNFYSGFNRVTEVWKADKGVTEYAKSYNEPIIASTKETDMLQSSSRMSMNMVQSANVHDTYAEAFLHNTNKLVSLSSLMGVLQVVGYQKFIHPTDIVTVSTGGADVALDGYYVVDTIRTQVDMKRQGIIHTYVYVDRDNKNNIENYIARPKKGLKILKKFFADLANAVGRLRVAYAMAQNIIDGRYLSELMSFAIETKRNLLRSFTVAGVGIDFNSSANLLQSLTCVGNSLMNSLTSMIFPSAIADTLRDFVIRKPSLKGLLAKYIAEYVPVELRTVISLLTESLFETTSALNSIAVSNGIRVTVNETAGGATAVVTEPTETTVGGDETVIDETNTSEIDYTAGTQEKVNNITEEISNNSSWLGIDIPLPIIELTESQSLFPEQELKHYIVDQTVANLTNLGYMEELTPAQVELFKKILLGEQSEDTLVTEVNDLARQINQNAGNTLYYRYWGTFGAGENNTLLYAWIANDEVVYTEEAIINANSSLYNFDGTSYGGEDFYISKKDGIYRIMFKNDSENIIAIRNSSLDKKDKRLLDLTAYYIKKCYKDKYRTLPCTKFVNATQNARIFFACPSNEKDVRFYINSKRVDIVEDLENKEEYIGKQCIGFFQIDLGYITNMGIPVPYTVYYTNTGYNSNSVLFEVKQGGMV